MSCHKYRTNFLLPSIYTQYYSSIGHVNMVQLFLYLNGAMIFSLIISEEVYKAAHSTKIYLFILEMSFTSQYQINLD